MRCIFEIPNGKVEGCHIIKSLFVFNGSYEAIRPHIRLGVVIYTSFIKLTPALLYVETEKHHD